MQQNNIFVGELDSVITAYPNLSKRYENDKVILSGTLELFSDSGEYLDVYEIEIHPTPKYPKQYPLVFEVGGRIPRNVDWHIYEDLGNCCIAIPAQEYIDCFEGINLLSFIRKQVSGYFFNQTFKAHNGYFYTEYSHGALGILEGYKDILDVSSLAIAVKYLEMVNSGKEFKSNAKCFCGSKSKFRKCHRRKCRQLMKAAGIRVISDAKELSTTFKNYR